MQLVITMWNILGMKYYALYNFPLGSIPVGQQVDPLTFWPYWTFETIKIWRYSHSLVSHNKTSWKPMHFQDVFMHTLSDAA